MDHVIVVAGATGGLGRRIARALVGLGPRVRAIVRPGSEERAAELRATGVAVVPAGFDDAAALAVACADATCVVSALSGVEPVIVGAQCRLLDAAVAAAVPRFIPSDYAADYFRTAPGLNRNFDLRRRFNERLDRAPISATSILNGGFMDMLSGQIPMVLWRLRRVLYFGSADQPLDFTTMDDVAAFTAAAALDPDTPRFLRIAGDVVTARDVAGAAEAVTRRRFGLLRGGSVRSLVPLARLVRAVAPGKADAPFPPWQGLQYMRDMFSGEAKLETLDNDRYGPRTWTRVGDVLAAARRPAAG